MDESQSKWYRPVPGEIEYWRSLWKRVHVPPPFRLFHYTDASGLLGIITSGQLWASHGNFLNDTEELRYATSVILSRFDERMDSGDTVLGRVALLRQTYSAHTALWNSAAETYIVSFCEHGNLLSQWRAYAANGQGFALGFGPDRLMSAIHCNPAFRATSKLFRVLYDSQEQKQFVDLAIDQLLAAFETHEPAEVLNALPSVFSELAFCFKHPAFAEEKEWRLVCVPQPNMEQFINVRQSVGRLVPFVAIPFSDSTQQPPFLEISHGPTLDAANTKKALQILLGKRHPQHWSEIAISGSDAPLRLR